jgi:ActR/RegA family two-component response regulator
MTGGVRILLVEDDPALAREIIRALERGANVGHSGLLSAGSSGITSLIA